MKKYTKKQLTTMVSLGMAVNVSTLSPADYPRTYTKVGFSRGIYGTTALLLHDYTAGIFYVAIGGLVPRF